MANPQNENGFIAIANEIVEQLAKINLCPYEWRVVMVVLRKTWGWNKELDYIAVSQIVDMTGLWKQHASRARNSLIKKNILVEQNGRIGFNKNYDTWDIKRSGVTNSNDKTETGIGDGVTDTGYREITNLGEGVTNLGEGVTNLGDGVTGISYKSSPVEAPQKTTKTVTKDTNKRHLEKVVTDFLTYWNSKQNLPQIKTMTNSLKEKFYILMNEPVFNNNWRQIIDKISQSTFCTGGGPNRWKADVNWLLRNSTNYVKVLEGNYDGSDTMNTITPPFRYQNGKTPRQLDIERRGR